MSTGTPKPATRRGDWDEPMAVPAYDSPRVGEVTSRTLTTQVFDVSISALDDANFPPDAEFILRVNGRIVTRMNEYRARRLGLIL